MAGVTTVPEASTGIRRRSRFLARSGERDLEVAGVGAEQRLIEAMIEHLVAHAAKAAAAFLDAMEIGEALRQDGIPRAGPVFALAEVGESDGRRRQTRAGNDHTIGKHFEHDFPSGILVLAVGHGVDQGFPQRLNGILVQPHTIQAPPLSSDDGCCGRRKQWPGR